MFVENGIASSAPLTTRTHNRAQEVVDENQRVSVAKDVRPSLQVSQLVVEGVLPPQVFPLVYEELVSTLSEVRGVVVSKLRE